MQKVQEHIPELDSMKKYPTNLFYSGNIELLKSKKISVIGSRKPSQYSKTQTHKLCTKLSKKGVCIVSGGAMGIDAISHIAAGSSNTISVLPCGIDLKYPAVNKNLLSDIESNGLLLSQFDEGFKATPWSFVVRNEVVVALGDVLIVSEAELESGSMRSIEFALEMGKNIYVLPHRLDESSGTNTLLKEGKAKAIYDIDKFVSDFCNDKIIYPHNSSYSSLISEGKTDEFLEYCKTAPTYDEALSKYSQRVFEAELEGKIDIKNGRVYLL